MPVYIYKVTSAGYAEMMREVAMKMAELESATKGFTTPMDRWEFYLLKQQLIRLNEKYFAARTRELAELEYTPF